MKQIKQIGEITKFSFAEMTSNDNGKTSATSSAGLYIIFIGGICFLLGCIERMFIDQSIDIINQSVMFTGIGATLLGVKNVVNGKKPIAQESADPAAEPEQLNS